MWERPDDPIWDENGVLNPSRQMRSHGVTREWTFMLRPWLWDTEISGRETLRAARLAASGQEPWGSVLDVVPALDRDCQIRVAPTSSAADRSYQCTTCWTLMPAWNHAAVHQLGEHAVDLLIQTHGWDRPDVRPFVLGKLVEAAQERNPNRWHWLPDELG